MRERPLVYGPYDFRLWVIHGTTRRLIEGPGQPQGEQTEAAACTSLGWDDSVPITTGEITLREAPFHGTDLRVNTGDLIACEVALARGGSYRELWRMRVWEPAIAINDQEYTYQLASDLRRLDQSFDDFVFVKDKLHPQGWRGDQIIRALCEQYGISLVMPKLKHVFKKLVWHGNADEQKSVYALIVYVLTVERNHHQARYRMDMVARTLRISAFAKNTDLLAFAEMILDASYNSSFHERFATEVEAISTPEQVKAKDAKGHRRVTKKKITATVRSQVGIQRYGLIHRRVYSKDADSVAALHGEAQRFMARVLNPAREMSFSHEGIPSIRRGETVRVNVGQTFDGQDFDVFTVGVRHAVTPQGYTMNVTLQFDDPFTANARDMILNKLTDTAVARERTQPKAKKKAKTTTTTTVKKTQKAINRGPTLGKDNPVMTPVRGLP